MYILCVCLCRAVCAEAFNPDEDDEDKEPRVNCVQWCDYLIYSYLNSAEIINLSCVVSF